jgi:hypothetical protein
LGLKLLIWIGPLGRWAKAGHGIIIGSRDAAKAALVSCAVLGLVAPRAASAQENEPPSEAQSLERSDSPYGIGFQSSWPAWGVSGIYDVNDRFTAQAVLGAFGTLTTLTGRGLYHFQRDPAYSLFGFGTLGIWRHSFRVARVNETETSVGIGGGAGVELNWQRILSRDDGSTFPPFYSNIDIGLTFATFDAYAWSALTIGVGFHYRF